MSFPIHCDNCGADFKLPDGLFEKKVKGKTVTIRCKHCKEEIFVDGTQLETPDEPQAPKAPEPETRPATDDAEPATSKEAAPVAEQPAKPAEEKHTPVRNLSVEASLAGVFDDAPPESMLGDDAVESVPEQRTIGEALARKPPGPPRRERKAAPEAEAEAVDVDLDEAEFDIDFSSLSAPLDLKAPSLAELTTPPTPAVADQEAAAGKWVLKPPDASFTTATEARAKKQPGPLSSVSESIALPLARPKPSTGKRNWLGVGLVMVLAAGAMYGVGYFAGRQGEEAPTAETAGQRVGQSAAGTAQPGTAARPAAGDETLAAEASEASEGASPDATGARPGAKGKRLPGALAPGDQSADEIPKPSGAAAEDKPEPGETVKPAEAPAAAAAPFNKGAAVSALKAAAASAGSCRRGGDPSGVATVVVTFASSGRAINANVAGPPFAGTPTGGCIASTMRRARVPPFSGSSQTVSKRVVIR